VAYFDIKQFDKMQFSTINPALAMTNSTNSTIGNSHISKGGDTGVYSSQLSTVPMTPKQKVGRNKGAGNFATIQHFAV